MEREDFDAVMDEVRNLLDVATDGSRKGRIEKVAVGLLQGSLARGLRLNEVTDKVIADIFDLGEKLVEVSDIRYGN